MTKRQKNKIKIEKQVKKRKGMSKSLVKH